MGSNTTLLHAARSRIRTASNSVRSVPSVILSVNFFEGLPLCRMSSSEQHCLHQSMVYDMSEKQQLSASIIVSFRFALCLMESFEIFSPTLGLYLACSRIAPHFVYANSILSSPFFTVHVSAPYTRTSSWILTSIFMFLSFRVGARKKFWESSCAPTPSCGCVPTCRYFYTTAHCFHKAQNPLHTSSSLRRGTTISLRSSTNCTG